MQDGVALRRVEPGEEVSHPRSVAKVAGVTAGSTRAVSTNLRRVIPCAAEHELDLPTFLYGMDSRRGDHPDV